MSSPQDSKSPAQAAVDRLLAERGPIPHHRLQPIAHALRKAAERHTGAPSDKK